MIFYFTKVDDNRLIAPSIYSIFTEQDQKITTSKLISKLRNNSIIPELEKKILKNRIDDIFSQKVRNLISHKILEKNNLASVERNCISLSNNGKKIGAWIKKFINEQENINLSLIENNNTFKNLLIRAKLDLDFSPELLLKLTNFDISPRLKNFFYSSKLVYLGDLLHLKKDDLKRNQNIGVKSIEEFELLLKKFSLSFNHHYSKKWNELNQDQIRELSSKYNKEKSKNYSINIDDLLKTEIDNFFKKKKQRRQGKVLHNY